MAPTPFSSSNVFVIRNELGIVGEPIGRERENDIVLLYHQELARSALQIFTDISLAEGTTELYRRLS
jgi:hypothetical protein